MILCLTFQYVVKFNKIFKLQLSLKEKLKTNILAHVTKTNETSSNFGYRFEHTNISGEKNASWFVGNEIKCFICLKKQEWILAIHHLELDVILIILI